MGMVGNWIYRNASLSSSSLSATFIFFDIIKRNSLNSIVPFPLMSTSFTMLRSSFSVWKGEKKCVKSCYIACMHFQNKFALPLHVAINLLKAEKREKRYLPLGRCPRERITTPSSAIVIVPSSSLSKSINASLNSAWGWMKAKTQKQSQVSEYIKSCDAWF